MGDETGTVAGPTSEPEKPPSVEARELVFDTTALIDLYRGKSGIRPYFEALLRGKLTAYISVVSEAELWRGLRTDELERHEALLAHFLRLDLDSGAARQAGAWMQRHEAIGLGWMDALIVASASQADLTVLTRDLKLERCLGTEAAFETYHREGRASGVEPQRRTHPANESRTPS